MRPVLIHRSAVLGSTPQHDRIGGLLMAADADELRRAISEDYALKPVPRDALPESRPDGREPILGTDPGALLTGSAEP
jgi:hypothetical protein